MRTFYYMLAIFFLLLTLSCCNLKEQGEEKIIKSFLGHELQIPTNQDSIYWEGKEIPLSSLNTPYIIVNHIDSSGCISCKIRTLDWKLFKEKMDSLFPQQVSILFFIQSIKTKELEWDFKGNAFNSPIYYDPYGLLQKKNNLPVEERYHTFLINAQKKILLIGNPINNSSLMELYIKTLTERDSISHPKQIPILRP